MMLKADNTIYYYFTEAAFRKEFKKIFKNDIKFVVSNSTLKNIAQDEELEWNLFNLKNLFKKIKAGQVWTHLKTWNMDVVMHKPKYYEPIDERLKKYEVAAVPNFKQELAAAVHYDNNIHPDQVVFVCTDAKEALTANLFFGSDSIIIV